MVKLAIMVCRLSFLLNISAAALYALELPSDSPTSEEIAQTTCIPKSVQSKLESRNLNTEKKFESLAEKLDYLTVSAGELSSKNSHISSNMQEYLEGAVGGFFISADFLYWQADEDKLEYAINFQGDFSNSQVIYDRFAGLDFAWNPGFRVAVGGSSCDCDHWGIYFNYTQIRNKAHGSVHNNPSIATNYIIPAQDHTFLGSAARAGHADWSVNYSTEHLEAYKDYFVGRRLILKPHAGLINANINQKYHVTYDLIPGLFPDFLRSEFQAKCNYWGLGVGGGADVFWHFTPHFGIYGELSLGLLYGKFNIHQNGNTAHPTTGDPLSFSLKKEMWRTRATLQTALGLEWETIFNRNRNRIAMSLGYEFNEWFQQNQFIKVGHNRINSIPNIPNAPLVEYELANADLAFKGITVRATFNF